MTSGPEVWTPRDIARHLVRVVARIVGLVLASTVGGAVVAAALFLLGMVLGRVIAAIAPYSPYTGEPIQLLRWDEFGMFVLLVGGVLAVLLFLLSLLSRPWRR